MSGDFAEGYGLATRSHLGNAECKLGSVENAPKTDDAIITGRQIAAGRTLICLRHVELADRAFVSVPILKRMEASKGPAAGVAFKVAAVVRALEALGIVFTSENGPGVRLRKEE